MKKTNYLKAIRVALAFIFLMPIALLFIDYANLLPDSLSWLLRLQIMPAILSGSIGILIFQFVLALLFGRIYCSTICPAGVLQDIINNLFSRWKKKKSGSMRFSYHKPMNTLRYSILGATTILALFGIIELCTFLDPYSNFGRIASNLIRPILIWCNNIFAGVFTFLDKYPLHQITIVGIISGLTPLLVFILMVIFRGRLFCNTICPVGTMLSLISRYSIFKISFNNDTCTNCGACERVCKAEAIDSKNMKIDASRCVDCFNCISTCAKGGLRLKATIPLKNHDKKNETKETKPSSSRRVFFSAGATVVASLPLFSALAQRMRHGRGMGHGKGKCQGCGDGDHKHEGHKRNGLPIVPSGALSINRFKDICTGCQICVSRCPSHVLKPSGLEYGFDFMLKPHLNFSDSYCDIDCTVCSDVCPTHAIKPISKEEKAKTQIGIASLCMHNCLVKVEGKECGLCAEKCPTGAIKMVPFRKHLRKPTVDTDLCIGCGACESVCPTSPIKAIFIQSKDVHSSIDL